MKKVKLLTNPTKLSYSYLERLNEYNQESWEQKAKRFQQRRWRELREAEA